MPSLSDALKFPEIASPSSSDSESKHPLVQGLVYDYMSTEWFAYFSVWIHWWVGILAAIAVWLVFYIFEVIVWAAEGGNPA